MNSPRIHTYLKPFLIKGYENYVIFLQMTLGLTKDLTSHLRFSIARDLNNCFPNWVMGKDLEQFYYFFHLKNLYTRKGNENIREFRPAFVHILESKLNFSSEKAQEQVSHYFQHGGDHLQLTEEQFKERLKKVDTEELRIHARQTWDLSDPRESNKKPYPIFYSDLISGENLKPPSSRNIGEQLSSYTTSKSPIKCTEPMEHAVLLLYDQDLNKIPIFVPEPININI
jgi:hypothetical protein